MCGHGGEQIVNIWVLNDKGKKTPASFLVDGYEPETKTVYQYFAWAYKPKESYIKTTKEI